MSQEDAGNYTVSVRNKYGEKYYVVPGGGVEDNESFEEAAIRESMEELGTSLYNLKEITKVELDNDICSIFTANELNKFEPTGEELKNLDPNNYYEVQLHNITDIQVQLHLFRM